MKLSIRLALVMLALGVVLPYVAMAGFGNTGPGAVNLSNVTGILGVTNGGTGGSTTATSGRYLKGNGSTWATSTGSASGTGSCTNQAVTATNSDAAPTCTTLTSAYVDTSIGKTASGINQFAASGGDYAMGTHKLTGLSAGSAAGDSMRYEQTIQKIDAQVGNPLTTVTGTSSETSVYSFTMTGGVMGSDGMLDCWIEGNYLNSTTADTPVWRMRLGGSGVSGTESMRYTYSGTLASSASIRPVRMHWRIEMKTTTTQGTSVDSTIGPANGDTVSNAGPALQLAQGFWSGSAIDFTTNELVAFTYADPSSTNSTFKVYTGNCNLTPP